MATIKPPEIWSDLHQDLVQDAQGNIKKSINEASVRTSIDNILNTSPGERLFLPEFAAGLKGLLFEPLSQYKLSQYSKSVRDSIHRWDNRVIVEGVDIKVDTDNHYVEITTRFSIKSDAQSYSTSTRINA